MSRQRTSLRIPEVDREDSENAMLMLRVLLSFYPFKNPQVVWRSDERTIKADFDFLASGNEGFDALTLKLVLETELLPKFYGDKGPVFCTEDELLECLLWDSDSSCWKCEIEIRQDHFVTLQLESQQSEERSDGGKPHSDEPDTRLIERARNLASRLSEEDSRWRAVASDELLGLYNQSWNDGPPMDAATFQSRLSLRGVALNLDGTTTVDLSQDELFTNHGITLELDADGEVANVRIEG